MKKKKIIYAYFSGERQLIVDYLYQHKQWEPVYFLGTDVDHNWAKNKYPNSIIADSAKIRTGEFDYSKIGEPVPIDDKIIIGCSDPKNIDIVLKNLKKPLKSIFPDPKVKDERLLLPYNWKN